jgi:protein-tyrosine phosphatase
MPMRTVALTDLFNFRDLGGYPTHAGGQVAWGRLFRSDDLSRLTEPDVARFTALGIRTVVDLRRPEEVAVDGRIRAFDGYAYEHVYLPHPVWQPADFPDTAARVRYLVERYGELVDHAGAEIGTALRMIADPGRAPLVVHCLAGKDRTGVVCGLTLSLLGVPDNQVADDFALSEQAEAASWAVRTRDDPDAAARRWTHIEVCPAGAMRQFLARTRERYGSVERYAASIGVTADHLATMRAHLVV